jgi:hypothetical protein
LETAPNLLELLERLFSLFSKCALKSFNNQADFDSAIRRFDPSRPSQDFSSQNNQLAHELRRIFKDSMSRHVAKISVCFQGFPKFAGGSARHGRDMVFPQRHSRRRALCLESASLELRERYASSPLVDANGGAAASTLTPNPDASAIRASNSLVSFDKSYSFGARPLVCSRKWRM